MNDQTPARIQRSLTSVSAVATLSAVLAILILVSIPLLRRAVNSLSSQAVHLHRPVYLWSILSAALSAFLVLLFVRIFPKFWRSLQLGLIPILPAVWVSAITAFLVLFDLRYRVASFLVLIVAEGLTYFFGKTLRQNRLNPPIIRTLDPDLPVPEGGRDLLDREDIVNYLASIVLSERPSVVALTGSYGDGKTSALNLVLGKLRSLDDEQRPIIVKFSPWLPGDSAALVSSLLSDITSAIKREYLLPGLNQRARRYSRAILGIVPKGDSVKELFSDISQEERMKSLTDQVAKMPRRIIVALDNLDRMQAEELEVVFKVLRGSEELSSVTFICCFDSNELARILKSTRQYQNTRRFLEKFFQTTVTLPAIDQGKLRQLFEEMMSEVRKQTSGESNGK